MANKRKILETARKHVQKGAKDKALKEYEKLLKIDPRDARLRIEIGDAYRRWGQVEDAIATYTKVAQHYMAEGFDARAVAVYKQIQNLDPEHWAAYGPLADLYQRMGLMSEAINALQTAADGHHRAGDKRTALELLRKMATIDPSNTASRLKVADLLRQEGMSEEAVAEYDEVADELLRQGEAEQAASVLEKILEIEPARVATLVRLVENQLQRGVPQQAEPFARRVVEAEPGVPEHYERLAEVYRGQGRDDALPDVYRSMADAYRQRGDEDRARDIIQRFVPPDGFAAPADLDADLGDEEILAEAAEADVSEFLADDELGPETLLDHEFIAAADEPLSRPEVDPVAEETVLVSNISEAEDTPAEPAPVENEPDLPPAPAAPPPSGEPEQLLAEACVYLRYGKRDQAIVNLEAILDREPEHRGALEKLGEAHAEGDGSERAVEVWLRAAECARREGDEPGLNVLRDRIAALDPEAAATLGSPPEPDDSEFGESDAVFDLAEPSGEAVDGDDAGLELDAFDPASEEIEVEEGIDVDELEIDVDDSELDDELDPSLEVPAEPAPDPARDSISGPSASASTSLQVPEDIEEADFYMQQGLLDEAEAVYGRVLERAPNHPQALVRLGEIAAARGDDPSSTSGGAAPIEALPEPHPDVPDLVHEAAEPPDDGLHTDREDWAEDLTGRDGVEIDLPDPAEMQAAPEVIDPNAETDLDFDDAAPDDTPASLDLDPASHEPPAPAAESTPDVGLEDEIDDDLDDAASEAPAPSPIEALAAPEEGAAAELAADAPGDPDPDLDLALPPAASDTVPVEDAFDLAAELSEAFDEDASGSTLTGLSSGEDDGFAAVFSEFKKGVKDALSESDHEAHYDLGIAYREMGLFEDAMAEFRTAMVSESRRIDSLQMLGLCSLDQGHAENAVGHFEMALSTEDINEEQQLAIRFELGRAFEAMGDVEAARSAWEAVAAEDPCFCDVEERLARLADGEKEQAEDEPDTVETESFESFTDIMDEVDDDEASASEVDLDPKLDDGVAEGDAEDELEDPMTVSTEDFSDLIEEANAFTDAGVEAAEGDAAEDVELVLDAELATPVEVADEPEPEPAQGAPAAEEDPAPTPAKRKRKRKKISFV